MLNNYLAYTKVHLSADNGKHNHGDEGITRDPFQYFLHWIAAHQFERAVRISNPQPPSDEVGKTHDTCNENSHRTVGAARTHAQHKIAGFPFFPQLPKVRGNVLAIAIRLEYPLLGDLLKAKSQGLAVASVSLGSERMECLDLASEQRQHIARLVVAAVVDDNQLGAGNPRQNFLIPFPYCLFNDFFFVVGGHYDRKHFAFS